MSIVLNELEWAEKMISEHTLGLKPMETLGRVAKYYNHQGYKKSEVRRKLELFLFSCDPYTVLIKWENSLDRIVNNMDKYKPIQIDYIPVTDNELMVIDAIKRSQEQRLAFTFLCVAKYWNMVNEKNNNWVNTSDNEIMRLANITTSVKRQSNIIHDMREEGLLQFSKKVDNLNVRVLYVDDSETGKEVLQIDDFRNLGNQYLMYRGEPYFRCQVCGLVVKRKANAQKYCKACAAEMYIKKSVESVMRQRASREKAM